MNNPAKDIYDRVIEAMQPAEEIGGPEGHDYNELMLAIAGEATKRLHTAHREEVRQSIKAAMVDHRGALVGLSSGLLPSEKITLENGEADAWVCICGNMPHNQGFYPCTITGEDCEPDKDGPWKNLYRCDQCGRIINSETLYVMARCSFTVAVYLVELAYGGPEEGGWWYDCGEPAPEYKASTKTFDDAVKAYEYAEELRAMLKPINEERGPKSNVNSEGVFEVHMTKGAPAPFPKVRPHYE